MKGDKKMTKAELVNELAKVKGDLHFLMRVNIWDISTGEVKEGFDTFLKNGYNIDCDAPDALDKIKNYGKAKEQVSKITYRQMYEIAKETYDEYQDEYKYIGIRFENKAYKVGEICENSRGNIEREDIRDYPDYGTDEYNNLPVLGGTCAYDLSQNRAYDINTDRDNRPASTQINAKHCYIIAGDKTAPDFAEDDCEIIIKNAKVIKQLF